MDIAHCLALYICALYHTIETLPCVVCEAYDVPMVPSWRDGGRTAWVSTNPGEHQKNMACCPHHGTGVRGTAHGSDVAPRPVCAASTSTRSAQGCIRTPLAPATGPLAAGAATAHTQRHPSASSRSVRVTRWDDTRDRRCAGLWAVPCHTYMARSPCQRLWRSAKGQNRYTWSGIIRSCYWCPPKPARLPAGAGSGTKFNAESR
jgi:hypothetical protein